MNQNRRAVPAWDYILEMERPDRIIELGAYNGGFTLALGLHAWNIGCKIHSFEWGGAPSVQWCGLAEFLGVSFYQKDIWESQDLIRDLIVGSRKCILLCDGGNKPREFNTFAPFLRGGDIIAAHDFYEIEGCWVCEEIKVEHVVETVAQCGLTRYRQDILSPAAWLAYKR